MAIPAPVNHALDDKGGRVTPVWLQWFNILEQTGGSAAGITELTGDVTAVGPGVAAATISALAVTTGKIANLAVTTAKIADDAVTTAKILDDNVTYAKLQNVAGESYLGRVATTSGNVSEVTLSASQLAGRGSSGDLAAITLGTGLSMSGTTLSASATSSVLLRAAVTLTNAQFKALPTTLIQVVAAQGANTLIVFHRAVAYVQTPSGNYTNITAGEEDGLFIAYGDWAADASTFQNWTGDTQFFHFNPFGNVPNAAVLAAEYPPQGVLTGILNTALKIGASNTAGDYTGGGVANTCQVVVYYTVETL